MSTNESDDVLVYDEEKGEHVKMHEVPINENDKAFLKTLFEADGPLTTTDIREKTGMERYNVRYRYKKFGEEKYSEIISIDRIRNDESLATTVEEIKQAELTDKGRRLIQQGLIGDPTEDHVSEEVVLTKEEFENYRDEINRLESRVNTLKNTLDQQKNGFSEMESDIDSLKSTVESINSWKRRINTFVIAVKSAMEQLDVKFGKHLKEAQKEVEEREK